jgi:hypothetical protein
MASAMMTILKRRANDQANLADGGAGVAAQQQAFRDAIDAKELARQERADRNAASSAPVRCFNALLDVLNSMTMQTLMYIIFVAIFQSLSGSMRVTEEFFVDKIVQDKLVQPDIFSAIRRAADIYEWGNTVLLPGLFGDMGPCTETPGSYAYPKTCVDEAWPDGDGSMHGDGARPYSVPELVELMDQLDWTEGVMIRQVRAGAQDCPAFQTLGECFPLLGAPDGLMTGGSTEPFGFNWTHPDESPEHPWTFFAPEQLGSNPAGITSGQPLFQANWEGSGFVAVMIPFFSDTFLEPESGTAREITDYRDSYVNVTNGRVGRYHCIRTSLNGIHIKQLCDPGQDGNGTGTLTGAVRNAAEEFWNDLKRGHFIDARTRLMTITLQLKANSIGVRYRTTLIFEQSAPGAWLTSYSVETRLLSKTQIASMLTFANVALALIIFFCLLEGVELSNSVVAYFANMWNVMDWANYIIFFFTYNGILYYLQTLTETPENAGCASYMCSQVGYFDDWKVMKAFSDAKTALSLCVCVQLFKVMKVCALLMPKMGLATAVLKKTALDLLFFGVTFIIAMFAFSMMLQIQLGPVMENYSSQIPAFLALFRALFGDFDINEILTNSGNYLNALLFLGYLFVAVFIMLSMFLAILAEGQVAVRDDEKNWRESMKGAGKLDDEYGVVSATGRLVSSSIIQPLRTALLAPLLEDEPEAKAEEPAAGAPDAGAPEEVVGVPAETESLLNSLPAIAEPMQQMVQVLGTLSERLSAIESMLAGDSSPRMSPVPEVPEPLPEPRRSSSFKAQTKEPEYAPAPAAIVNDGRPPLNSSPSKSDVARLWV